MAERGPDEERDDHFPGNWIACERLLEAHPKTSQDEVHFSVSCRTLLLSRAFSGNCEPSFFMSAGGRGGGVIHFDKTL